MSGPIQFPLLWLSKALGIRQAAAPQQLGDEISPVIDVAQGGWGGGEFTDFEVTRIVAGIDVVVASDLKLTRLVWMAATYSVVGPAVIDQYFYTRRASAAAALVVVRGYFQALTSAYNLISTQQISGSQPLIVPPGYTLESETIQTIAGGSFSMLTKALILSVPAGYKAW